MRRRGPTMSAMRLVLCLLNGAIVRALVLRRSSFYNYQPQQGNDGEQFGDRVRGSIRSRGGVRDLQATSSSSPVPPFSSQPSPPIITEKKTKRPPSPFDYSQSFRSVCVQELYRRASDDGRLTKKDYATFLIEYCSRSPHEGPSCPDRRHEGKLSGSSDFSLFASFPIQIQLAFADSHCPMLDEYDKLHCLSELLESESGDSTYDEEVDELCAATSLLLGPTGLVVKSPSPSIGPIPPAASPTPVPSTSVPSSSPTQLISHNGTNPEQSLEQGPDADQGEFSAPSQPWMIRTPSPTMLAHADSSGQSVRSRSTGPIIAAVLIGASLGGFVLTALWLHHRGRSNYSSPTATCNPELLMPSNGDNASIPSEHSCEIYLLEPRKPPKPVTMRNTATVSTLRSDNPVTYDRGDGQESEKREPEKIIESSQGVEHGLPDRDKIDYPSPVPPLVEREDYICISPRSHPTREDDRAKLIQTPTWSPVSHLTGGNGEFQDTNDANASVERPIQKSCCAGSEADSLQNRIVSSRRFVARRWQPTADDDSIPVRIAPTESTRREYPRKSCCQPVTPTIESSQSVNTQDGTARAATSTPFTAVSQQTSSVFSKVREIEQALKATSPVPSTMQPHPSPPLGGSPNRRFLVQRGDNTVPSSIAPRWRDDASKDNAPRTVERHHSTQQSGMDESAYARNVPADDHFVLDPFDGPEVTSDVSDADQCADYAEEENDDDDDWTEETVSVAHTEIVVEGILENEVVDDDDSYEEEVVLEEDQRGVQPLAALMVPPLTEGIPALNKKNVKEIIALYDRQAPGHSL